MSREDPQFKLRMPADLREQADLAAKASGRSLNAELVARLEATFLTQSSSEKLIPAAKAKELAAMARTGLPDEIRQRALKAINRSVGLGHSSAAIDLRDLRLDEGLSDSEIEELTSDFDKELRSAGYEVDWDGGATLWIKF